MGEAKKREAKLQYYLSLDYRESDTFTIEDAEQFFSDEYDRDVFIIAEQNKICMDDLVCHDTMVCRYVLQRDIEVWHGDFEDIRDYDAKPYGEYWMHFMKETYRDEYILLQMNGQLWPKAEEINIKAREKITETRNELLKSNPFTENRDIFEQEKHLKSLEDVAEELILSELIYNKVLYMPEERIITEEDLPF